MRLADDATANVVAATNNPVTGSRHRCEICQPEAIGINQSAHVWTAADGCDGGMTGRSTAVSNELALTDLEGGVRLFAVVERNRRSVGSALRLTPLPSSCVSPVYSAIRRPACVPSV